MSQFMNIDVSPKEAFSNTGISVEAGSKFGVSICGQERTLK